MSIYTDTVNQNLDTLSVAGQDHTNGWVFSLPAGVLDNDLFEIVNSTLRIKTGTVLYCKDYSYRVTGVNGGSSSVITKTFTVRERGMRLQVSVVSTLYGVSYNSTVAQLLEDTTASKSMDIEFDLNVANFGTTGSSYIHIIGKNGVAGSPTASTYAGVSFLINSAGIISAMYIRSPAGGVNGHTISVIMTAGQWKSFRVSISASATPVVTLYVNGVAAFTSAANAAYHFGGNNLALDNVFYTGVAQPATLSQALHAIIADLVIKYNGVAVITDPMTSLNAAATNIGVTSFNSLS